MKKEGWGGGGSRGIKIIAQGNSDKPQLKISGKTLTVLISPGLPKNTS